MTDHVLILNAGSSSVKFALYTREGETVVRGQIKSFPGKPTLVLAHPLAEKTSLGAIETIDEAVDAIVETCARFVESLEITAVGHRVVHGGPFFAGPTVVDREVMARISALTPLAPSHQPGSIAAIEAAMHYCPDAVQTASFDTSFHRSQAAHVQLYALPRSLLDKGIRRYGFHGLSYAYTADVMAERLGEGGGPRIVAAHLGSGASLCAMKAKTSVATSMGFTALDGLPMATRSGTIDPGVLFFLMRNEGMSAAEVERILYEESGLRGLSEDTGDMAQLIDNHLDQQPAAEAIDYYCHRLKLGIAEMAAALGGIDALVFSGGVGENASLIRERAVRDLAWMGMHLDADRNTIGDDIISSDGSTVSVHIVRTDEEDIIRRDLEGLLAS